MKCVQIIAVKNETPWHGISKCHPFMFYVINVQFSSQMYLQSAACALTLAPTIVVFILFSRLGATPPLPLHLLASG